jgi:hypothetical protein
MVRTWFTFRYFLYLCAGSLTTSGLCKFDKFLDGSVVKQSGLEGLAEVVGLVTQYNVNWIFLFLFHFRQLLRVLHCFVQLVVAATDLEVNVG